MPRLRLLAHRAGRAARDAGDDGADGPHGLRKQPDEADHAGLAGSDPATCFPTACALASSWDPTCVRRVGEALGRETQARGGRGAARPGRQHQAVAAVRPQLRVLLRGPLLAGVLAAAFVQGVQSQGVGTSLKHFAANNQETDRMRVSADVDERTLREIYLPAFERVVTRGAAVDGDVLLQPGQRHATPRRTRGC